MSENDKRNRGAFKVGGTPVREFLLLRFGPIEVERALAGRSFVFTRGHATEAQEAFHRMGRRLAIDYEHQMLGEFNTRRDGLSPAAGWIGGLEVRADGLWAVDVEWTDKGRDVLAKGEYMYFSPVIYWSDEDYAHVVSLGPVALTNDPAMAGVPALAAKRGRSVAPSIEDIEEALARDIADLRRTVAEMNDKLTRDILVGRGVAPDDDDEVAWELNKPNADGVALRDEFDGDKAEFIAFRRAVRQGLVTFTHP